MADPNAKRKILYFLHGAGVGGAPLSLLSLLKQLDRDVYDPIAVFFRDSRMSQIYRDEGIQTRIEPSLNYFSHTTGERFFAGNPRAVTQVIDYVPSIARTRQLVSEIKPDLVHCNSSTLSAEVIGAKKAGVKVVWHIREHIVPGVFGLRRRMHYMVARRYADCLVFILESEARRFGVPHKSEVVPNFVDFAVFDRRLRDSAPKPPDRLPTVVFFGGLSRIKGARELVLAYPLVREAVGPVKFLLVGAAGAAAVAGGMGRVRKFGEMIAGQKGYAEQVRDMVAANRDHGVVLGGVVEDVPSLLAVSDLVVFPATAPHFARPVIEAAAMGLPVVASDLEGPRELVRQGHTGLLVEAGNHAALAQAIITLLTDPDLARRFGNAGYEMARAKFDAQSNSRKILRLYEGLLGGGGGPSN